MSQQEHPHHHGHAESRNSSGDLALLEDCFAESAEPTIGVETEHLIESRLDKRPLALFDDVLDRLPARIRDRTHGEFLKCQIEYASGAHATVGGVQAELREFYEAAEQAASAFGATISWDAVAANWEFDPAMIRHSDRSRVTVARFGSRMPHLATCAMHVHTAVGRSQAIAVCDGMQSFVPLLLAASANSPARFGRHHAIDSRRGQSWGHTLATLPFPLMYGDWDGFRRTVDQLQQSGLIESQKCLYAFLRPTRFGTVENRVFDLPRNLTTAVGLAALNQALIVKVQEDAGYRVPTEVLHSDLNRAIADGPHAELMTPTRGRLPVVDYLSGLIDELAPISNRLGSTAALDRLQRAIAARCRLTAPVIAAGNEPAAGKRSRRAWPRIGAAFVAGILSAVGLVTW